MSDIFKSFYINYFLDYWELRYKFLKDLIENSEKSDELINNIEEINTIPNYKKKFITLLKFEIHFLKFQVIEALFNFIFALEKLDDIDLWFNLSFPSNISERSFAAYDKISEFKNLWELEDYLKKEVELNENLVPYWKYVFYYDVDLSNCGVDVKVIESNIIKILNKMARTFADRDDYNAYKHSLVCFSTSLALSIIPHDTKESIPIGFAKNGMNYLTKSEKEDDIVVNSTFKAFSPKEDLYYIREAMRLLKNIINIRKPHFSKEKSDDLYYCQEITESYHFIEDYMLPRFSRSTTSLNQILNQAVNNYEQDNINNAIVLFKKVLQLDDKNPYAILGLGYSYQKIKEFDNAIKNFRRYTNDNRAKYWKRAQYNLALCFYEKNDLTQTDVGLAKLTRLFPDDTDSIVNIARYFLADIKLRLNQQHFEENGKNEMKYIKATSKLLKKAEELSFEHPELWFSLAIIKSQMGHLESAKEIFEKLNKHFPDHFPTKLSLAHLLIDSDGNLEEISRLLQECEDLNKESSNLWIGYSILRKRQGDIEGCREACKKAIILSKNPEEEKQAFGNIGAFLFNRDDYESALEYYQKSLEIDNEFFFAFEGVVNCLLKLKRYEEVEEITRNLEFSKSNRFILKTRAYTLSYMNRHHEALELIDRCIEAFTEDLKFLSDLYDSKGDLLERSGDKIKALEFYQKSLDTGDGDFEFSSETREKLSKLKSSKND